jgi:hypothetical protein
MPNPPSQRRELLVGRWIEGPSTVKQCSGQKQSRRCETHHCPTKEQEDANRRKSGWFTVVLLIAIAVQVGLLFR